MICEQAPAPGANDVHAMLDVTTRVVPNGVPVVAASMRSERMHHTAIVAPL